MKAKLFGAVVLSFLAGASVGITLWVMTSPQEAAAQKTARCLLEHLTKHPGISDAAVVIIYRACSDLYGKGK